MKVFMRLLSYMKPYWRSIALIMLLMSAGTAFDLLAPWLLKQAVDVGMANKAMHTIIFYCLLLGGGQLMKTGTNYLQGYTQERVGQSVVYNMRRNLYDHLQKLPYSYFDKAQTGQIMSRMTGDIETIKNFFAFGLIQIVLGVITFFGTIGVMLAFNWKVTLISMLVTPLLMLAIAKFGKKVGPAWGDVREQMGKLTSTLQENISGIRVVKAFAQENLEKGKFDGRNEDNFATNMKRARIEAGSFPLMGFYGGLIFLLMIWLGSYYVVKGEMTLGTFTAFQWYIWGLVWPLNMTGWMINIAQQAIKAAPRVFEILDTDINIASPANGGQHADGMKGRVEFRNLTFRYDKQADQNEGSADTANSETIESAGAEATTAESAETASQEILRDINLEVQPGEAVAILGGTGSGKSTLIQMIARFYDATEGAILIDGVDVRDYNLEELRRKIGIVPQETFLFSATIRDNIAFGRPEASLEQVEWAAKQAQIHDFILTMPNGYETIVGERGVGLSGGQRQRVALARAILMDPPILVLDEATASVDTATESAIHEALHSVMEGRTTFIVAQRLSSIQTADRIIVLDNGKIAEQGTHKELYEQDGFFRKLFNMQQWADMPDQDKPNTQNGQLAVLRGGDGR
ncbi:ABC transporter ATP-binding protein [Gorillibacterium massiliense]|uniref:ABC transporter ATP-binding protein n=1 Tax=Gorillibacterium massiliense TaxID=1280390 RepID=UPI0004B83D7D|nr:ABC transporter ATP-binding protein [Gorillibacterium massiliense]